MHAGDKHRIDAAMSGKTEHLQPIVVFDFGKTNAKMFVFGPQLSILYEERCATIWREQGQRRVLDTEALWVWMQAALRRSQQVAPAGGIMITTHGCTGALLDGDGLVTPILDYESASPPAIEQAFASMVPEFQETFSPPLPGCMNLGKQFFWIEVTEPQVWDRTEAIVPYPQFWCWKLGAPPVSELTSLACHTHLWSPRHNDFSSLVYQRDWRRKFPRFAPAGAVIGSSSLDGAVLRVHNGVHDSNAALYLYREVAGHRDCALVSTGTWVVVFNPRCPHDALTPGRAMLANTAVCGKLVPTAVFMGGREFDVLTLNTHTSVTEEALENVIQRQQYALPSFAPGGPFAGRSGCLIGPAAESNEQRSAIATLYLACMTSTVLDLLHAKENTILIDGGVSYNAAYVGLLAALRADQEVRLNGTREGTAAGAAALAYTALGHRPKLGPGTVVEPMRSRGLLAYYRRWRELCADHSP